MQIIVGPRTSETIQNPLIGAGCLKGRTQKLPTQESSLFLKLCMFTLLEMLQDQVNGSENFTSDSDFQAVTQEFKLLHTNCSVGLFDIF